jgi:hypothetical protein
VANRKCLAMQATLFILNSFGYICELLIFVCFQKIEVDVHVCFDCPLPRVNSSCRSGNEFVVWYAVACLMGAATTAGRHIRNDSDESTVIVPLSRFFKGKAICSFQSVFDFWTFLADETRENSVAHEILQKTAQNMDLHNTEATETAS